MTETVQIAIIASLAPTLAAIAGIVVSLKNSKKIKAVQDTVNGKLGLLLRDSKAAGKQEDRVEEAERKKEE